MSAFLPFAQTAERIAATSKRLEKAAILSEYFAVLPDDSLRLAARYFAGTLFPLNDARVVNIGGATLLAAMLEVSGADETLVRRRLVVLGDPGDVALEIFPRVESTLELFALNATFELLAQTSGSKRKIEIVTALLRRADALEAKYIVKLLSNDLRIGLKEGAVEDALSRAAKVPVGAVQRANMLTGDIGETALLARHARLDSARMRLFHPIKFMLATPAADLEDVARQMPAAFIVEDKFDGIRAQAHIAPHVPGDEILHGVEVNGRRVALFSRTLDEITRSYPDLLPSLAALLPLDAPLDSGLVLDGEILPVRGDVILPFQELQQRLGRKTLTPEILARVPVAFIAYDALYGPHQVLLEDDFATRRAILESLPFQNAARLTPSQTLNDVALLDDEFDKARARGNEGLMIKDPRASYKPGRRGREWLKIKRALATLDVVVTAAEVGSGRRAKFLSDYTFAVRASETDATLLNVGKAYSGLTDEEVQRLSDWFNAHTLQEFAHGKVKIVEPQIVLEITFDRVQPSPRHKSGFALRFPRILRIRDDKPVGEIDTLETVRRLAQSDIFNDAEA